MSRNVLSTLAACLVLAGPGAAAIHAQATGPAQDTATDASPAELGFRIGYTRVEGGQRYTRLSAPSGGPLGRPVLYLSGFIAPNVALEPQFGFDFNARALNDIDYTVWAAAQASYYFKARAITSPLVFADIAVEMMSSRDNRYGLGTGIAYRWSPRDRFLLRAEARYRYWLQLKEGDIPLEDGPVHEFTLAFGLGILINR